MTCARCGCGVYRAEDQVIMTKVWHKCCFRCSNCNSLLNKCSARLIQGDIFCDQCHDMIRDDLEILSSSPVYKTCRVVSSPSCICPKEDDQRTKNALQAPTINYSKKYDIHIPSDVKKSSPAKVIKSCSCLPELDKDRSYCFAFPIPREVANYYNRINMRRKSRQGTPNHLSSQEKPVQSPRRLDMGPCITIRTVSPSRKHRSFKCHGYSKEVHQEHPVKCCCTPSPTRLFTNCDCICNTSPCSRRECTCYSRGYSPIKRNKSPSRQCPPHQSSCCSSEYRNNCRQSPPRQRLSSDPDLTNYKFHASYADCPKCREFGKCPKCSYCNQEYLGSFHRSDRSESFNDRTIRKYPNGPQCSCPIHDKSSCEKYDESEKVVQHCVCGKLNPCNCKISKIRDECTSICVRCNRKVYAAEKICISSGPFHTSCFSCYCCHKLLDVKNVYEHKGEIYCKNCYNTFMGNQYYGYGASQCC